jgi:hypothetical protein
MDLVAAQAQWRHAERLKSLHHRVNVLSLFWSGACALEQFIANYYFLDPSPLHIGKDSQTFNVTVLQARDKLRTTNTKSSCSILISQLKL